ncbi:uncharacterized protein LOC124275469 [Haliotis rubra]|uniref:uncharacterized protein LOC124275469 n=1 Tax=Haliotis rubra TaxID=36100 RepID=UPI001EE53999|nr:uncharacterized protein LOC124275469 [Haliotis rubra]
MEYDGNDLESIISLSMFYTISHTSGHQPQNNLSVTLPLPDKYTGEGELLVLSRTVPKGSEEQREEESKGENEEDENETYWTILDTVISVNGNVATFSTNHFSEVVVGEYTKNARRSRVKKQTKVHRKRGVKDQVIFAAWGKFLNSSVHDVVVECCHRKKFKKRSQTWQKKGYSCLRNSGEFQGKATSIYCIGVRGNAVSLYDISTLKLIYKRGMTGFQSLHLGIMNEKYTPLAAIAIMDKKKNVITYLPFELDQKVTSKESMAVVQKADFDESAAKGHGHENIEDYIRDTLMDTLSNDVFESWWKVWLYAGVPVEKLMDLVTNLQFNSLGRSKQMFQEWIIGHAGKPDYGLQDLIKALMRAECRSAAQQVMNHLKKCLNSEAFEKNWSNTTFGKWLKTQNFKLEITENEASRPMSDVFLVDILQYFAVDIKSLGIECGLTTQEHCELSERHPFGQQFQLFTVLCKVRQKAQHRHEGLRVLLKALKQLEQNDTKNWIITRTRKWPETKEKDKQSDAGSFLAVIAEFSEKT